MPILQLIQIYKYKYRLDGHVNHILYEAIGCSLDTGSRLFHSPLLSLVFQNINEKSDCPKSTELYMHLKASHV